MGPTLSLDQQIRIIPPFTAKEIKDAIFSIPNEKSPGADGFSSGFFKKSLNHLGTMVINAIQEFFKIGKMLKRCNITNLVLLPKVNNPESANDFRPISCYNVVYKGISKLLSNGLKEVLPELVNQSQRTFIKRRELLFNVLVCQEITKGYNRQAISPKCMMKIDLKKAYDSIHWDFMVELMDKLRFPKEFTKWIKTCITTTSFSLQLNGSVVGYFQWGRGLG